MRTLAEARDWYLATLHQIRLMRRLGDKFWDQLPWEGPLGQDPRLRSVERTAIAGETELSLRPLADLAVLVLFSVFEANVRELVLDTIEPELAGLRHPTLRHAALAARDAVEEGSFFRVLEPFKTLGLSDSIEEVNQVRRYRSWVAHGRRGDEPPAVTPEAAFDRLDRLLRAIVEPGRGIES